MAILMCGSGDDRILLLMHVLVGSSDVRILLLLYTSMYHSWYSLPWLSANAGVFKLTSTICRISVSNMRLFGTQLGLYSSQTCSG